MALTQKLEIRHGQALVMTPQLMQAIKLLQLSNLDLNAYVEGELERNPLLERAGEGEGDGSESDPVDSEERGSTEPQSGDWAGENLETSRSAIEGRLGTQLDNVFPDDGGQAPVRPGTETMPVTSEWAGVGAGGHSDGDYNLEAFVSAEITLADHLNAQLMVAISDPGERMIGQHLIDLVDDAGYLAGDFESVAEKLGAPMTDIEAVLSVLQNFDPPGVCARNLPECLAIQLRERDRFDPAMQALVANLDLLARRDVAALKRVCGVDDEDLADMIAEIKRLNPKPGFAFGSTIVQPVVPDVFVRPGPDGGWLVELNSDTLPKVLINQIYYAQVAKTARNPTEKAYLSDCMQTATWLVRALDQRARTILKVATEIVRQQDAFFAHGVRHLRPLNLKTVADAISMHESTVSRVTANKYMATSRGIYELKYFFTSAIAAADGGEAHSAEAVRDRIKQLIDMELPGDILSDDTIVEKLHATGVDIARRTVAKYREAMRIPSSVQRRREKQAAMGPSA
ncbi:MAG TPA: RNA polymerase factor sigma-54 [Xanthobacteraceae bacterium]|jgi:RNA polymerase sigma-54 factor|nr:RNA polymerase factor sigma-54 [Xanthobacteraceae bacterium]